MRDSREGIGTDVAASTGAVVGVGGAATAAAVLACCSGPAFGPLVVSLLGAAGAVALERLRPYALPLLTLSGLTIGISLWSSIRRTRACALENRRGVMVRASQTLAWLSVAAWLVAVALVVYSAIPLGGRS